MLKDLITSEGMLFFISMGIALALGLVQALLYTIKNKYTKSFLITLLLLPASVSLVILMINGNIGLGVAVAGAFSLVRFRSIPGKGKEIVAIFIAMVTGLTIGAKYFEYAVIFSLASSIILLILNITNVFEPNRNGTNKVLQITIPEDLNYTAVFEEVFKKYTKKVVKTKVKTTNLGSMYKLTYEIVLIDSLKEKEFIDELRCLNGNLEVSVCDDNYEEMVL